jgi:hypothetical protein
MQTQHFEAPQRAPQLSLIMSIAAAEKRPSNNAELLELRQGFREIGELHARNAYRNVRIGSN